MSCPATREAVIELGDPGGCPLCERPADAHEREGTVEQAKAVGGWRVIACRAQVVDDCFDGEPAEKQFGEDRPMSDDGTFDGRTIVCDPCYTAVQPFSKSGRALELELPEAIRIYRSNAEWARAHENPQALVAEVEAALKPGGYHGTTVTPDTPAWRSMHGCLAIAKAEIERREKADGNATEAV